MIKETRLCMGMPITIEIAHPAGTEMVMNEQKQVVNRAFEYFDYVDKTFSTYKPESDIMKINRGEMDPMEYSSDMKEVLDASEKTHIETDGFFNIKKSDGSFDPSGLVKGWAIQKVAQLLEESGISNFYVDAGGDIQTKGKNNFGENWNIAIRDPFMNPRGEAVRIVSGVDIAVATSGTYIRGDHIYNPHIRDSHVVHNASQNHNPVVSLTVVGEHIYDADRFATAAFAMGEKGLQFIEALPSLEGCMILETKEVRETSGFKKYTNS